MDHIYINSHNDTLLQAANELAKIDHDALVMGAVNEKLNDFIRGVHSRNTDQWTDNSEYSVPFFGWFWRNVDFFDPHNASIAEGEGYTGICQNNKWDHEERSLTASELAEFGSRVWAAYQASRKGGLLSEIHAETDRLLEHAGEFIRGLDVGDAQ